MMIAIDRENLLLDRPLTKPHPVINVVRSERYGSNREPPQFQTHPDRQTTVGIRQRSSVTDILLEAIEKFSLRFDSAH